MSMSSSKSSGKQADLSSAWSEWTWSEEHGCNYSYRYGPTGEIEYDYFYPEDLNPEDLNKPSDYSEQSTALDTEAPPASLSSSRYPTAHVPKRIEHSYLPPENSESWHLIEQSAPADTEYVGSSSDFEIISKPTRFFKIGRVFKALWTEPAGENPMSESPNIMASPFGGNIFTKMRHFVVVREMKGCCICLSMFTYSGQGTTKKGVRPEDYAAVYAGGNKPQTFPAENLTREPFPIIVENPSESIHPMSRLNFGRIYTLEHNIKVLKVGRIPDECHERLLKYYVLTVAGPTGTGPSSGGASQNLKLNSGELFDMASDFGSLTIQPRLPATATQVSGSSNIVIAQTPYIGVLGDMYREIDERKNKKFWKPGRVFMMLWTEPARTSHGRPSTEGSQYNTVWLGQSVYSEIRRFVVIGEGYGNVICSPIYTYSRMATLKPNLPDPQQHAMIYTSKSPPKELSIEDEEGNIIGENLSKDPIRVIRELDLPEGELGTLSRINYAKIYTVEKYVRVLNIGKVHEDSMEALLASCFFARPEGEPPQGPRKSSNKAKQKGNRNRRENNKQSSSPGYQENGRSDWE